MKVSEETPQTFREGEDFFVQERIKARSIQNCRHVLQTSCLFQQSLLFTRHNLSVIWLHANLISSYLILSHLILSYLILSYRILIHLISSDLILLQDKTIHSWITVTYLHCFLFLWQSYFRLQFLLLKSIYFPI